MAVKKEYAHLIKPAAVKDPPKGLYAEPRIWMEAKDMEGFITAQPRSWKELIIRYLALPYPLVYRGFGRLRHKLGRANDGPAVEFIHRIPLGSC